MDRVTIAAAGCEVPDRTVEELSIPRFSPQDAQVNCRSLYVPPTIDLPPCICGIARSLAAHDLINLENSMSQDFLPLTTDLATISDEDLAKELSRVRAIVSVTLDGIRAIAIECLVPLRALAPSMTRPECVIVQDLDAKSLNNQFAVFTSFSA